MGFGRPWTKIENEIVIHSLRLSISLLSGGSGSEWGRPWRPKTLSQAVGLLPDWGLPYAYALEDTGSVTHVLERCRQNMVGIKRRDKLGQSGQASQGKRHMAWTLEGGLKHVYDQIKIKPSKSKEELKIESKYSLTSLSPTNSLFPFLLCLCSDNLNM